MKYSMYVTEDTLNGPKASFSFSSIIDYLTFVSRLNNTGFRLVIFEFD